ncbi:MAG: tetratricopeptide repeat protein [Dehalococcoidia bacterium]|nr:MAG: tetratricopeptide repeat protein [Dehalococcoidia bacterium]
MAKRTDIEGWERPASVHYPAKVTLPASRPAILHRQRLTDLLAEHTSRRVTIVSAPAGYGKTTLLLDFDQSWQAPICWYSLDERDRDLRTFLGYWVACGRAHFPSFGQGVEEALAGGEELSPAGWIHLMVSAVQEVGRSFILVFDDFHHLDEAPPELRRVLEGWLYRLPADCHVVLSTRTQPDVGVLPLMTVRQEVATVTAADFAFTCEEVARLYRDILNKEIPLDDAQHLADVTEGWAAALILMADKVQVGRTSISLEQLKGSDTLFQYIDLEQFSVQPQEVQRFLTDSAVPLAMEPQWLNELLGIDNAEEMMDYLERHNLFVTREGTDRQRYRYHRLFRAFLVSRLRTQQSQRFTELNQKAAAMFEREAQWQEAVYHLLQARAWERIIEVTERVGRELFEQGKWDILAEWLEAIPGEELDAQPKLVLWKARVLHYLNRLDQALAVLARPIQAFEAAGDEWASLAEALVTKGMCLRMKGAYHEAKEALTRARSLLLEHDGPTSVLTEARKELGITQGMCGEFAKALEELKGVLDIYQTQGDAYNIAHVSDELGITLASMGRLGEAVGHLERARVRWQKLGNDQRLMQARNNLGMLYHHQGELGRAEEVTRQGLETARQRDNTYAQAYLLGSLADVQRDRGQLAEAIEQYRRALDLARELDDAYLSIYIMDGLANAQRMSGDIADAEATVRQAAADAEERGGVFELGICNVSQGLIQRDRGLPKEAVASLERAITLLREGDAKRELSKAYFHLAEVYFSLKRKRLALDCLDAAARLVQELGYDHFLRLEASRAPLLVQYAAAHKLADGYYARMLKAMKNAAPAQAGKGSEESEQEGATSGLAAYGFGNLRVEMNGREVTDLEWRSEKSKEMFFIFLCNRRPLRKEEIVTALWPDLPDEKTGSLFHSNLYRLRQALYPECIAKDSGRYILDPQGSFWFDVEEFQEALKGAEGLPADSDEAIALMEKARALYTGQFASEFYSEWAETLRWQLEEQHMRLLTALAGACTERGEYKRSADLCQQILTVNEYNEAAWYRLMSNYVLAGQMEAAAFCYRKYVDIVSEGLGGEDIPEFEEICRQIRGPR